MWPFFIIVICLLICLSLILLIVNMKYLLIITIGLVCVILVASGGQTLQTAEPDSLRLVSVFFRHGARTPEWSDTYPHDSYKLDSFQPMGYGQLTNYGKHMGYTLGQNLRKRYQSFLGDLYVPGIVYARSTDVDRTKMSGMLALAGLFPPNPQQQWNDQLNWMPIPLDYEKEKFDYMLRRPNFHCPAYMAELEKVYQCDQTLTYLKTYKNIFQYIANHTGKPINKLGDIFQIYQTLTAEMTMNLTLPEWTKNVYPEDITNIAAKQCEVENSTPTLKRLNGGRMLGKVISDMKAKSEGTLHPHERKIFLYSGHETNVLSILAALNLYNTHFPEYSSAVLIELHYLRALQDYAVKVLYGRNVFMEPEELKLENCEVYCPLHKFIELTEHHVPKNYTLECDSSINLD